MQNFISIVGIFGGSCVLPIFALCAGVSFIGHCCDCLTLSSNGFWVAFWVKNTFCMNVLYLNGPVLLFLFLWEDHNIANDSEIGRAHV